MVNKLIEFDLAGAEWVVVAYLSGDQNMIDICESGRSPHIATGSLISGASEDLVSREHELIGSMNDPDDILRLRKEHLPELFNPGTFLPRSMSIRQAGKKSNHGLNYDMRYRRFALENEMPETDAQPIVKLYREQAYPGIVTWHEEIRHELKVNDRVLENLMDRRVRLLEQPGPDLWDKAYSFKPQSTVADIVIEAMISIYHDTSELFRPCKIKANVYDSILLQYPAEPWDRLLEFAAAVKRYMSPVLRCKNREFVLGVDAKIGDNWGSMEKLEMTV